MQIRAAFLVGWLVSYLIQRRDPAFDIARETSNLARETAELKEGIKIAQEAVEALTAGQTVCEWEVWRLRWLLRFGVGFEILLVLWFISFRFPFRVVQERQVISDTGGSSSSETEEPTSSSHTGSLPLKGAVTGKGSWIRSGPLRPSDLRQGKQV